MFIIQYRFDDDLYNGSMFETELLRDNNNMWYLLIGDIYYYKGEILKKVCITERITTIHNILKNEFINDEYCNICPLIVKKYFEIVEKDNVINNFIPQLNYKTRGIYFVPINVNYSNILYMFSENELKNNFKLKKNNKNILNFKIMKTMKPEVYELYLNGKDTINKVDYAYIPNIVTSEYLYNLFVNKEPEKDIIIECEYNNYFKKWQPLKETTQRINHISDLELV
jgi:hypothetical protein